MTEPLTLGERLRHQGVARRGFPRLAEPPTVSRPANEQVFLRAKLYPPATTRQLICRPRLHGLLDHALQVPFTLVSAAAGYGKSVAVSQWLESIETPGAWLSLDAGDRDAATFLRYTVAAIRTALPAACQHTEAALDAPHRPPTALLGASLVNDLDAIDAPFVLVLDDYHRLGGESEVHELISRLLCYPPRWVHLVVISRCDPPLSLSRLRAAGQLADLTQQELAFTDAEVHELVERATGRVPEPRLVEDLQRRVEGWGVGLGLIVRAMRGRDDGAELARALRRSERPISEYLLQEVIASQPPAILESMLRLSILDRFCAGLCDAVCGPKAAVGPRDGEGCGFEETLEEAGLFTIRLDEQGVWFRFHPLLRQTLRAELERRVDPTGISALHRRAGVWLADAGLIDEAVTHALAGEDPLLAARIVESHRFIPHPTCPWYFAAKWLPHLPGQLKRERPGLLIAQAWVLYGQCRVAAIGPLLDAIDAVSAKADLDPVMIGELSFFRGHAAFHSVEDNASLSLFETALQHLPKDEGRLCASVQIHYALALQKAGHAAGARRHLRALVSREEISVSQDAARLQTGLGLVHLLEADLFSLQREIELLDRGLWRDAAMPMAHWWCYLAAVVRLLRHDADAAPPLLEPNMERCSSLYRRLAMDSLAIRAVSFQSRGRGRDARASLTAMAELAAHANDPCSHAIAASCHARIALMDGQLGQARERIETLDDAADRGYMFFWFETPRLTECRLLVAEASKRSLKRTLSRLDRYERESRAVHNKLKLIEILTLQATALARQGRTEQALASLREAVDLASPGWVTWPFVELGQPMADLLGGLAATASTTDFVRLAIDGILNPDAPLPIERRKTPDESLTEREHHVLNLLVSRLTDKEIARRLDVSPQTVNSHLKSIYRKLGVSSRRQAANAARALGTSQRPMGGAAYR